MQNKTIVAVGSVALDSVETPFGKRDDALGGSATFFSAAARFFAPVHVVAVVGDDFPKKHIALLQKLGVDTSGVRTVPGKTFRWQGYYGFDLNSAKTLKTELGVFQDFKPSLSNESRRARFVFLGNIDPALQLSVLEQMRAPELTACDTMNYWIGGKKKELLKLLKKINIFLCNDAEARQLTGEPNLVQAARAVLALGPKLVVIKKGEHGVLCFSKKFIFSAPAYPLESVFDPTGAGDSFAGGFFGYLTRSPKLAESVVRKAIVTGSVIASYNVESFSLDRLAALRPADILKRYRAIDHLTRF